MARHDGAPALSDSAERLLGEFYASTDLAAHLRAIPEAARTLGLVGDPERDVVLAELEQRLAATRTELEILGLYPATTTAVEVLVNGEPIDLPGFCREQCHPLSTDSPTKEGPMDTVVEHPTRTQLSGQDLPAEPDAEEPGFFDTHVRPYTGHAAAFVAGALCGALGASYFGADAPIEA